MPTDGTVPAFTIELRGLSLDGAEPRDVRVAGDEPSGELLDTALTVLRALALDSAANGPLAHLLAMLGMGGDTSLPPLPLADALAAGRGPILVWLRDLAADPAAVRTWLGHLAGLLGLDPLAAQSGDGGAAAPLAVTLPAGAGEVAFTLVLGTAAATGDPVLRPGLRVRLPAPPGFPGRAEAAVELAEVTIGAALTARPCRPPGRWPASARTCRSRPAPTRWWRPRCWAGHRRGSRRWRPGWRWMVTAGRCWCSPPWT